MTAKEQTYYHRSVSQSISLLGTESGGGFEQGGAAGFLIRTSRSFTLPHHFWPQWEQSLPTAGEKGGGESEGRGDRGRERGRQSLSPVWSLGERSTEVFGTASSTASFSKVSSTTDRKKQIHKRGRDVDTHTHTHSQISTASRRATSFIP